MLLDYGTGPGRNIIKFNNRFKRIDGVDIGKTNIENAKINLKSAGIEDSNLYVCDGKTTPVDDESYDVWFSVICLQHIGSYDIRYSILEDALQSSQTRRSYLFPDGIWWKRYDKFKLYDLH